MRTVKLLIENVRTDGGSQSRAAIDEHYVSDLAELLEAGGQLPPIDVFHDGSDYWCADGFHRIIAHVRCGRKDVDAGVHKGTREDAIWHSCGSNTKHGLRRTHRDKQNAVTLALKTKPKSSTRVIADHCLVSAAFVEGIRRALEPNKTTPPKPPARVPPKPPAPKPPFQPPAPKEEEQPETDKTGREIPDHIQVLFDRAGEVQSILNSISGIKSVIARAQEEADPLFAEVDFQTALTQLDSFYNLVKATLPYAVCPFCHGENSATCRACTYRGVLGEYRYRTLVPSSMKKG